MVDYLVKTYEASIQRGCRLIGIKRSSYYYKAHPIDDSEDRKALKEAAHRRRRWGYRFLMDMLKRDGRVLNHKKVERLYREEGLQLSKRRTKKVSKWRGEKASMPQQANERWSMDFVHDRLVNGKRLRMLNVVDDYTRECLWIEVGQSLGGERVAHVLEFLVHTRAKPKTIVMDNGPEFCSRALDKWADDNKVSLHFIQPGKPVQNAFVESFNGKLRYECLNDHWFENLAQAEQIIHDWRDDYNHNRPHSSLGYKTPLEFAKFSATPLGG
jgi:putative transposase